MADWIADAFLAAGEPVPAPAPLRQAFHRSDRQLLWLGRRPAATLMTRLSALLAGFAPLALQLLFRALPRQLTALLSRQRQIRRRRHRTVARGAVHLPLKLLDPLLQPRHLAQRIKQPDNQRPCGLPTSHRDRFRLDPIHDRKIPSIQKESCSPLRHHLNAYDNRTPSAVLQNVADGIVTADEGGLIESFNQSARRLFGYTEEEVIGQPLGVIIGLLHD